MVGAEGGVVVEVEEVLAVVERSCWDENSPRAEESQPPRFHFAINSIGTANNVYDTSESSG